MSAQGMLMIVVGLWIILRTTHTDSSGRTLANHVLGTKNQPSATTAAGALGLGALGTALLDKGAQAGAGAAAGAVAKKAGSSIFSKIGGLIGGAASSAGSVAGDVAGAAADAAPVIAAGG